MSLHDLNAALFIAYKTIVKGNKSVTILLITVLSLVFFNLIFIKAFLTGFSEGVLQSMIDTSTAHIILSPEEKPIQKSFIPNQEKLRNQIETIPGVVGTLRHYSVGGTISFDKNKTGSVKYVSAPILGFNQKEEKTIMGVHKVIRSGTFPDILNDDEILIGASLAGDYENSVQGSDLGGVRAGDKVTVHYVNGVNKIYTVRGIFEVTIGFTGSSAFISDKEAERILSVFDQSSEILVRVDLTKYPIESYVRRIQTIAPQLKIEIYKDRLAAVGSLIDAFNVIALIIVIVSILVSAATIFIMIYINALSKKRHIGILKAIGIKNESIELSYMLQAVFFSLLATITGSVFFVGIVRPYMEANPIKMPYGDALLIVAPQEIIIYAVLLIGASLFAGMFSSRVIARKPIVENIWK
jgi:putative ABC transport system permease protein